MHGSVMRFLRECQKKWPAAFSGSVLEYGSLDVNGSPRKLFDGVEYVGVDWRDGDGVDQVALMHEYKGHSDGYFDLALSTSTIEHDPYWCKSLRRVVELLKPGGLLILTYAGYRFARHGLEYAPEGRHYESPDPKDVKAAVLACAGFRQVEMSEHDNPHDVRIAFVGKL